MKYTKLTPEQQQESLDAQLIQAEADHFRFDLNAKVATDSGDTEGAKQLTDAMAKLEKRVEFLKGYKVPIE